MCACGVPLPGKSGELAKYYGSHMLGFSIQRKCGDSGILLYGMWGCPAKHKTSEVKSHKHVELLHQEKVHINKVLSCVHLCKSSAELVGCSSAQTWLRQ